MGWASLLCLNLGGLLFLHWANRYKNDPKYDSKFLVYLNWTMIIIFISLMMFVSTGLIELNNSASISFLWYSMRNPPIWAMNLFLGVGIVLSIVCLMLRKSHRLTSRCTGADYGWFLYLITLFRPPRDLDVRSLNDCGWSIRRIQHWVFLCNHYYNVDDSLCFLSLLHRLRINKFEILYMETALDQCRNSDFAFFYSYRIIL